MALYLRYVYMCAVGEKVMFAIPISKTDQRFFPFQHWAQRRAMSMALYLRYEYMCAVGEKGMFAIPISKTDPRFFPFQHRGSEEGYEHGFVSQV
jgi:hypothetical protein